VTLWLWDGVPLPAIAYTTFNLLTLGVCGLRWPMKLILRQYRGNILKVGQHCQPWANIGRNILRQYRKTFIPPTLVVPVWLTLVIGDVTMFKNKNVIRLFFSLEKCYPVSL